MLISRIKEGLRRSFAEKANEFSLLLDTISLSITKFEGALEVHLTLIALTKDQLQQVKHIKQGLAPIGQVLGHLKKLDLRCQEAHIEENDYTIYSYDDLEYAFNLAKASVDKKLDFIQNQVCRSDHGANKDRGSRYHYFNARSTRRIRSSVPAFC